jgi:hypothetical protein
MDHQAVYTRVLEGLSLMVVAMLLWSFYCLLLKE